MEETLLRLEELLFPSIADVAVMSVDVNDEAIYIGARSTAAGAPCPDCGSRSNRMHSSYLRFPADVPSAGRRVVLCLRVRRFFCPDASCGRRTFVEQMPGLTRRHSRWTERLRTTLAAVGLALACRAGARMARVFGVSVSRSTVLRLLGALLDRETPAPRVVGVDEYAMRKGRVYGTVLVDVETRRPVDLLPDRDASTLAKPPLVEDALGRQMLALLVQLEATCTAADQLAEAVEEVFPQHPDAEIILSFPGLGIQLGARVLAEIGDDRTRFAYAVDAPGEDLCGRAGVVQGSLVGGLLEEALGVVACGFGVGQGGGECGWRR